MLDTVYTIYYVTKNSELKLNIFVKEGRFIWWKLFPRKRNYLYRQKRELLSHSRELQLRSSLASISSAILFLSFRGGLVSKLRNSLSCKRTDKSTFVEKIRKACEYYRAVSQCKLTCSVTPGLHAATNVVTKYQTTSIMIAALYLPDAFNLYLSGSVCFHSAVSSPGILTIKKIMTGTFVGRNNRAEGGQINRVFR